MHLLAMDLAVNPELIFKEGYAHMLGHLFILEIRKAGKFQYYLTLPYILPYNNSLAGSFCTQFLTK